MGSGFRPRKIFRYSKSRPINIDNKEIRIHPKSVTKFKDKIRAITSRSNAMSMEARYTKLKQIIVGWVNYFKIANMGSLAQKLDEWIRRRLRVCYWKQWKKIKTKHDNLIKQGIDDYKAWEFANTRKPYVCRTARAVV